MGPLFPVIHAIKYMKIHLCQAQRNIEKYFFSWPTKQGLTVTIAYIPDVSFKLPSISGKTTVKASLMDNSELSKECPGCGQIS